MDNKIALFKELADLYMSRGFSLYLVGGTVRDYLLNKELLDMDIVTDATPIKEKEFLKDADYTFERFGSIKLIYKGVKFDITTLRKESSYLDSRHPSNIVFTRELKEDYLRRDLTINALYLDYNLKVIDFVNGVNDLNNHIIKMVGDPDIRIKEDPLRIVRIYRFSLDLGFDIDSEVLTSININKHLLNNIRKEKILEEIRKTSHREELKQILKELEINNL